jgi:Fe-Mn family superoxide dismutase
MYKAKPLKFSFNALEPYLSEETVRRHYIIYTNYVKRLNDLIENNKYTLEETIKNIDEFPMENRDKILFLSSAILNHELYFENMGLNKSEPVGKLKQKIEQQYGSFENFKEEFKKQASYVIGSGYTFLILNNNDLEIINTSNQENPYSYDLIPIMNIDLWEHAYYIDYFNRQEYIDNFFSIIDFEEVNNNYEKNIK